MFKQQLIGILNLALPVVVIYNIRSEFLLNPFGQLACALLIGLYILFLQKRQTDVLHKSLTYVPTGAHKELVDGLIRHCNVVPEVVAVRYAYTAGQVALATNKMVVVDPTAFPFCVDDPQAQQVQEIFEKQIKNGLPVAQRDYVLGLKPYLTPGAERFMFKHELGHVVDNFTQKKLIGTMVTSVLAAYVGIIAGLSLLFLGGVPAALMGMLIGGLADLLLTYLFNATVKVAAEKKADRFAVEHSSHDDVREAALFFAKQQELLDLSKKAETGFAGLLQKLPVEMLSGHPSGKSRVMNLQGL